MCHRQPNALTVSYNTVPIPHHLLSKCHRLPYRTLAVSKNSRSPKSAFVPPIILPYAPRSTTFSMNNSGNAPAHRSRQTRKNISISTTHSKCSPLSPSPSSSLKAPVLSPCTFTDFEVPISLQTPSSSHSSDPFTSDPQPSRGLPPISVNTKDAAHLSFQSDISISGSVLAEPPSPMTAKMKQHAKLRRFLGESIPAELVYGEKRGTRVTHPLNDVPEETRHYTYWKVAPGPDEVEDNGLSAIEEDLDDQGKALEMRWGATETVNFRCPTSKRYTQRFSGKWVEEKSGRRWVADDYREVLDVLRKL